ncbi:helix-turn-helix domain-containing protein [Thermoactinospora rubra]|uniref:helix-turn-helix domain-containing protein n=1 Tax=Thermoactinospora rubra TaxID=1088767 RepID=UPI000A0FE0D6|nr:pyridoxamine 5'-phosphate oxidase family protein [Thermoactinospora rubra]
MTVNSDLGRRLVAHRERLGLTPEQVAERAEMDPGYLRYLEANPATPPVETLDRLAKALETTVDNLLGGGRERPPGPGPAMAAPHLHELDRDECLRLIGPGGVGRVAFGGPGGPVVFPVNYTVHEGGIVFRTRYGGAMEEQLRTGLRGVDVIIAFQVDRIDEARREGWSVLVQGPAHLVPEEEAASVAGVEVTPWAGGERDLYIRITPGRVTGRRISSL